MSSDARFLCPRARCRRCTASSTRSPAEHFWLATAARDLQRRFEAKAADAFPVPDGVIDDLIGHVAERIAAAVVAQIATAAPGNQDEWLDSRRAAKYLGVHRDTLRKLAAERAIPAEQDGPGCKLYFRRADLDKWRRQRG
jgi:excisionase family DNA binding protein